MRFSIRMVLSKMAMVVTVQGRGRHQKMVWWFTWYGYLDLKQEFDELCHEEEDMFKYYVEHQKWRGGRKYVNIKNEEDEDEPNIDETRIMVLKLLLHPPIKWPHLLLLELRQIWSYWIVRWRRRWYQATTNNWQYESCTARVDFLQSSRLSLMFNSTIFRL